MVQNRCCRYACREWPIVEPMIHGATATSLAIQNDLIVRQESPVTSARRRSDLVNIHPAGRNLTIGPAEIGVLSELITNQITDSRRPPRKCRDRCDMANCSFLRDLRVLRG